MRRRKVYKHECFTAFIFFLKKKKKKKFKKKLVRYYGTYVRMSIVRFSHFFTENFILLRKYGTVQFFNI